MPVSGREICCCQISFGLFFTWSPSRTTSSCSSTPLDIFWVPSVISVPPPFNKTADNTPIRDHSLNMAEDKKSDDYTVEMNKLDQGNKEFEAAPPPTPSPRASPNISNNPALPVLAYCGSSIMMTVMNKYVLSGLDFNLNFLLLCVQVCGGFSSA